jgi:hypothetical protein
VQGFVTKAVSAKVHRNENLGAEVLKGVKRLFRVHMIFTKLWAVIGSDREQGNFGTQLLSYFTKSVKIT